MERCCCCSGYGLQNVEEICESTSRQPTIPRRTNKDHLDQSHSGLIASASAVAKGLLQIALDPNTKNYAEVSACQAVLPIIDKGVTGRENAEQLQAIKESLNALEGGRVIDLKIGL